MTTPLQAYLPIQVATEKLIRDQLLDAASEAEKIIKKLSHKDIVSTSAGVRIAQYRTASAGVREVLDDMWKNGVGPAVAAGIGDAAAESASMNVLTDVLTENSDINRDTWERSMRQTARQNVNNYRTRIEKSYIPLSTRVYRNSALAQGQVDRVINNALILGKSARETAKDVQQFIDPNVRGGTSYAAMRLARTELNNAFHATTIMQHGNMPWVVGMQWNLSGSHPKKDICDDLVKEYKVNETPSKPHPQCLCYVTPVTESEDKFVREFKAGKYDDDIDALLGTSTTSKPAETITIQPKATVKPAPARKVSKPAVTKAAVKPAAKPAPKAAEPKPTVIKAAKPVPVQKPKVIPGATKIEKPKATPPAPTSAVKTAVTPKPALPPGVTLDDLMPLERRHIAKGGTLADLYKVEESDLAKVKALPKSLPENNLDNSLSGANPKYLREREYQINCLKTVAAFEMRMRGYDVQAARQSVYGSAGGFETDPISFMERWRAPSGDRARTKTVVGASEVKALTSEWEDNARGFLYYDAYGAGSGHIISFYKTGDTIHYVNPQGGMKWTEDQVFEKAKDKTVDIVRSDNLTLVDLDGLFE